MLCLPGLFCEPGQDDYKFYCTPLSRLSRQVPHGDAILRYRRVRPVYTQYHTRSRAHQDQSPVLSGKIKPETFICWEYLIVFWFILSFKRWFVKWSGSCDDMNSSWHHQKPPTLYFFQNRIQAIELFYFHCLVHQRRRKIREEFE